MIRATMDKTGKRVFSLFRLMWDDQQRHLVSALHILEMMDRLIQSDNKYKSLFTAEVADTITDYTLYAECQRQIMLYQPWASTFELECAHRNEQLAETDQGKRRAMQLAEKKLGVFWGKLDQHFKKTINDLGNGIWTTLLSSKRTLQRTPEWVEPERKLLTKEKNAMVTEDLLQNLQMSSESTVEKDTKTMVKDRVKTRGTVNAPAVFSTLFYQPSPSAQPGEIPWNDFLHAMTSTGFGAEKLYGSVWHFTPSESLGVDRSIQFHEPHPSNKIPFNIARYIGRRLLRANGKGEMFKLENSS
ncbi:hypothetical protein BG004_004234 [Podila humilis]|nr:hypothetical protein BG004_004234 [Podila humilis]